MGILCNILVTVGVLLSLSGQGWHQPVYRRLGAGDVLCGPVALNHSIADMTYCMLGLFAKGNAAYVEAATAAGVAVESLTWGNYLLGNLIPVTLGNIVGGAAVGFTYWFSFLRGAKKN